MESVIYCYVNAAGEVFVRDGAGSDDELAATAGLDESACTTYRFDLALRRLLTDRGQDASDRAAREFVDTRLGTPEKLMAFAREGRLSKQTLANLLTHDERQRYLDACARIERMYTDDCAAKNDPCLASGCAVEGEGCLEAVLNGGVGYQQACAADWIERFASRRHRVEAWQR